MSLSEQSRKVETKWDLVIRQLRENHRKIISKSHCEISVFNSLNKKEIKTMLILYLNDLKPALKKSSKLSEEIRIEGNKIFKLPNANLFEACFLYSLALKCCSEKGDFAFCHGNRAAALMKIGFNQVAMNDCYQALKYQHPDPFKIYERLCSLSHNSLEEMRKNLAGLEKHLKKSSKQSREIIQHYKIRLKAMEKEKYVNELPEVDNLLLECKDDVKVKQMINRDVGRYVVAQKAIAKHEKIFSELPFAFIPVHNHGVKKYFNSDCENCGLVNIWPFLCLECRMASYCSPKCCEDHQKIHKYECEGYKINLWFEIGIAHLSIRCLLVGFPSLLKKIQSFDHKEYKNKPEKIFKRILQICNEEHQNYFESSENSNNDFHDYAKVIGLVPNLFHCGTFPTKNMPYAVTAQMLTIYLRDRTSFFQDHITKEINILEKNSDWDLVVGALIMRHMGQLVSNGHAIVDFRQNVFTTEPLKLMVLRNQANGGGLHLLLKSQRVFTGIFPKVSMLNHSCSSNIRNVFEGKELTIFSNDNILKDGEIFNCYGPNCKLMSYREGQDTLRLNINH
ncbi:CLUMA_CG014458, isoform A [Clunio marinus]|uniref:CLUMA_CG014458, isoform A n=1 Tax=Clunio marinus TaxID=568069 RepID=A0A1J1IPC5_9DIPT|nr:CLUMA_CG014458, isoform A [Clunio marinus]